MGHKCFVWCGKRTATIFFALAGLIVAAAVIVPPVYVHHMDQDYDKLFPILKYGRIYLERVTEKYGQPLDDGETFDEVSRQGGTKDMDLDGTSEPTTTSTETNAITAVKDASPDSARRLYYRLAFFQLMDDTQGRTKCMASISFCIGCLNVLVDLLLLCGACFRKPLALLPWLVVTLTEHIVLGVPIIVFFAIISLYLAAQLHLHWAAAALIGSVVLLFILSLSSWFTVYSCYHQFGKENYGYDALRQNGQEPCRRAGQHTGQRSSLPPGHPSTNRSKGYRIQENYYPPHQSSRQLPPVPP